MTQAVFKVKDFIYNLENTLCVLENKFYCDNYQEFQQRYLYYLKSNISDILVAQSEYEF